MTNNFMISTAHHQSTFSFVRGEEGNSELAPSNFLYTILLLNEMGM